MPWTQGRGPRAVANCFPAVALLPPVISLFWTNFFAVIFAVPIPALLAQAIGTAPVQAKKRAETQAVFRANREKLPPRMAREVLSPCRPSMPSAPTAIFRPGRSTPESTELGSLGLGSFTTFRGCTGRNDIADAAFAARGRAGQGEREWRPKSCRRMSRRRWRRSPKCTPQAVLNAIKAHGEANASGEG